MAQYFDTSVLIAAFVQSEQSHEVCAELVTNSSTGCVLAHGMAECFSFLTGGRLSAQISPKTAAMIIETNIIKCMEVITLTPEETLATLKNAEANGIRGAGIYDALHLAAARKIDAKEIFTLNLRHFQAFAPDLIDRIKSP
jgi:predicted nucleic acid-binding protein